MEEMTIKNAETKPVEEVLEEKKPAHKKSKKERMDEVKKEIKEKAALIKELRANKNKTQEEKEKLSSLIDESEELKIEKDTLKKEIDAEKLNASIRQRKKKLADKKQEAIMKLLEAEGITTENEVKGLIAMRRFLHECNLNNSKVIKRCLDYVKQNNPSLLNQQ